MEWRLFPPLLKESMLFCRGIKSGWGIIRWKWNCKRKTSKSSRRLRENGSKKSRKLRPETENAPRKWRRNSKGWIKTSWTSWITTRALSPSHSHWLRKISSGWTSKTLMRVSSRPKKSQKRRRLSKPRSSRRTQKRNKKRRWARFLSGRWPRMKPKTKKTSNAMTSSTLRATWISTNIYRTWRWTRWSKQSSREWKNSRTRKTGLRKTKESKRKLSKKSCRSRTTRMPSLRLPTLQITMTTNQ